MTNWQTKQLAGTFVDPRGIVQYRNFNVTIPGIGAHSVWLSHIGVEVGCLAEIAEPLTWVLHGVWNNRLQR